ncbi:MAG: trehalase family glycosidase [Acidobacteriota bacterium]
MTSNNITAYLGARSDRSSAGHGNNIAVFVGEPYRIYYVNFNLGEMFSPLEGKVIAWYPDHVRIKPIQDEHYNHDTGMVELEQYRDVFVTEDDVIGVVFHFKNRSTKFIEYQLNINGSCRGAINFRGSRPDKPCVQEYLKDEGIISINNPNVYPTIFSSFYQIIVVRDVKPDKVDFGDEGFYSMRYNLILNPGEEKTVIAGMSVDPDQSKAIKQIKKFFSIPDPLKENEQAWNKFFQNDIPKFRCPDHNYTDLWYFRWYLLKFSSVRGGHGFYKYPVVLEGRSAYQIYCAYSAPFIAKDLIWSRDPSWAEGPIKNMVICQYEDGRFPWYTTMDTNDVPLHHKSASGNSFLVSEALDHFKVHGDVSFLEDTYPAFSKNIKWWIKNRDRDNDGLFIIEDMLETGMDDSPRAFKSEFSGLMPLEAVDATSYLFRDLTALREISSLLKKDEESKYWESLAELTRKNVIEKMWDEKDNFFYDGDEKNSKMARVKTPVGFYPFFAGLADKHHFKIFDHLIDSNKFWLRYPVPSVSRDELYFDANSFWRGPSWPATTCHVLEAFSKAVKVFNPEMGIKAVELIDCSVKVLFSPQIDFYERYNPLTGKPLSKFKDYMHSWWLDIIIQQLCGFVPLVDGRIELSPLPIKWDYFSLENLPWRNKNVSVYWDKPDGKKYFNKIPEGYTMKIDKNIVYNSESLPYVIYDHSSGRVEKVVRK